MAEFKESEEFKLVTQDFEAGYDKDVKEIFYNIWRKHRNICYKFLGKEYQKHFAIWDDQERSGILATSSPPSLDYSDEKCEILRDQAPNASNAQDPLVSA